MDSVTQSPAPVLGGDVEQTWLMRANMASSIKPEVHNVSLRRQRTTEPRPSVTCTKHLMKIGCAVPRMRSRTEKHTHTQTDTQTVRHAYHNTQLPNQGRSNHQSMESMQTRGRRTMRVSLKASSVCGLMKDN